MPATVEHAVRCTTYDTEGSAYDGTGPLLIYTIFITELACDPLSRFDGATVAVSDNAKWHSNYRTHTGTNNSDGEEANRSECIVIRMGRGDQSANQSRG
jgi:hypothetical protein